MHRPLPRTKIVATIGPASDSAPVLERMVRAGVSVVRINFAHGSAADHGRFVHLVRSVSRRVGRPVAIMADLAGPKIRIGELPEGKMSLAPNDRITFTTERGADDGRIFVTEPHLTHDVRPGDPIYLSDGTLQLAVEGVKGTDIRCRVVHGGILLPRKGVNLPGTKLHVPSLTRKDRLDLKRALALGIDAIALSFVRAASDVTRARKLLRGRPVPLIAKIEKREAVNDLEAVVVAADGVMVARGDLAVETSLEEVPLLQKRIVRTANDLAKPVITATQMLLSMVDQPRPTRAEAADVANAILDGSDAIMLSEETARGQHPVTAVETMARIALQADAALETEGLARTHRASGFVAGSVSDAAVTVAHDVEAKAIVTPTFVGATPRFVARLRPAVPVVALSENRATIQQLCFTWGVVPVYRARLGAFDRMLDAAEEELRAQGLAASGDRFVVTAGYPPKSPSNLMTVQVMGARGRR